MIIIERSLSQMKLRTGGVVTRVHKGRKLNYISCEPHAP